MTVVVNGAFRSQRITGQQRYATEIADRLSTRAGFDELTPSGRWRGSAGREWMWTLTALPMAARGRPIVSLTARAPMLSRQILVVHDLFVLTHPEWYSRRYVATHAPALRLQIRRARAIAAVSEPVAAEVARMYDGPVVVAPNAPSEVFLAAPSAGDDAVQSRGLTTDGYLLTVGNHDPRKNLDRLAAAWAEVPEAERLAAPLVVVGGGAAIYRQSAIEWPTGTVLAGYVSDDELRQLYAGARAVIFPSLAEGFGLPLVEAAAAGARRMVASDIDAFRWICGSAARYIDPQSTPSIAEGVRAALRGEVPPLVIDRPFAWSSTADTIAELSTREDT